MVMIDIDFVYPNKKTKNFHIKASVKIFFPIKNPMICQMMKSAVNIVIIIIIISIIVYY